MEFKNDLGLVGKIAAHSVMSGKYKDKDGNIKEILPVGPGNSLDFDQFREDIGAFGGGSGGTDIDKEHPSAGADYYAGSLADGEITERNLEWSGTDDPTKDLAVTFKDDPGSNPFGQYSGLTVLGHIQKTVMTSGTKGAVSNLELNYDPSNTAKDGYFTTTSPYPIYISQSDIASGQELDVPINGIGEGLEGDNTKPAMIHLKYNSDKTMTISHEEGYVNDGSSAGATGANYEVVVDVIATYSVQSAVAQLPASVNFFTGQVSGDIALSGVSEFFENSMDGIEITFDQYAIANNVVTRGLSVKGTPHTFRFDVSKFGIRTIRIAKEDLIIGNKINILPQLNFSPSTISDFEYYGGINNTWNEYHVEPVIATLKFDSFNNSILTVKENSVINLGFNIILSENSGDDKIPFKVNVAKVTPYKN